jgi:hypothetical protein
MTLLTPSPQERESLEALAVRTSHAGELRRAHAVVWLTPGRVCRGWPHASGARARPSTMGSNASSCVASRTCLVASRQPRLAAVPGPHTASLIR